MKTTHDLTRRDALRVFAGVALAGTSGCVTSFMKPTRDESLVAFLSDCHVGGWKSPDYQAQKLTECLSRVLALDPLPARLFILGDLAYLWGRKEDYARVRPLLAPITAAGIEITIAMGNHDRRENFLERFPEYAGRSPVPGRIVSVVAGRHCDYVLLDTLNQPEATDKWITPGKLDDAQREWLGAFCRQARRPFFVAAHHPATELGAVGEPGSSKCARDFGNLILGQNEAPTKCCGYIHGHDHRWYETRALTSWQFPRVTPTVCLPSTGHWGDIGFALMREELTSATLSLVQYDFFTPKPLAVSEPARADWAAIVRNNAGRTCSFVFR